MARLSAFLLFLMCKASIKIGQCLNFHRNLCAQVKMSNYPGIQINCLGYHIPTFPDQTPFKVRLYNILQNVSQKAIRTFHQIADLAVAKG